MKQRKYKYLLVIQGNYGRGWEDESEYDSNIPDERKQAYDDLHEYNMTAGGHRLIRRRVLNDGKEQR